MDPYNQCVLLGQRLRARRRQLNLKSRDVAIQLGVSQPTVSRWENGRCPEREHWPALAEFLDVSIAELGRLVATEDEQGDLSQRVVELEDRLKRVELAVDRLAAQVAKRSR